MLAKTKGPHVALRLSVGRLEAVRCSGCCWCWTQIQGLRLATTQMKRSRPHWKCSLLCLVDLSVSFICTLFSFGNIAMETFELLLEPRLVSAPTYDIPM